MNGLQRFEDLGPANDGSADTPKKSRCWSFHRAKAKGVDVLSQSAKFSDCAGDRSATSQLDKSEDFRRPNCDSVANVLPDVACNSISRQDTTQLKHVLSRNSTLRSAGTGWMTFQGRAVSAVRCYDFSTVNTTTDEDMSEVDAFPCFLKADDPAVKVLKHQPTTISADAGSVATSISFSTKSGNTRPFLRQSRFHDVPPTISFYLPYERVERPRRSIRRMLKWCHNSLIPRVVRKSLAASHFQIVAENTFWISYWGRHLRTCEFRKILPYQKVNHFPGTFHMGRKDRLWTNINRMIAKLGAEYEIMPKTYVLPRDGKRLRARILESSQSERFIVKPPASARGNGVRIVHKWSQVPKRQPSVVQVYIDKPYLIDGRKFDLRLYAYITSFKPLRVYLYEDGLVRFASVKYSNSLKSIENRLMHLTNFSVNKCSSARDDEADVMKWNVRDLWSRFAAEGKDVRKITAEIVDVMLKAIICCEESVNSVISQNTKFPFTCHELFGFDIVLDEHLKPWLVEVNISPSLHSLTDLDVQLKSQLIRDVLNLAGMQIPEKQAVRENSPRLPLSLKEPTKKYCMDFRLKNGVIDASDNERAKHVHFTRMFSETGHVDSSILNHLTPADVRILIETEDEYDRRGGFARLIPSPYSSAYLKYFETPRYYNLLLDEWTNQYYHIREAGCAYLNNLCKGGVHLQDVATNPDHQWQEQAECSAFVANGSSA